ncbi:nucleotide-sugar transporter-domain-containing protein [Lasiosphaeria miniovina]|uniref:Nucleotide-sugar transporter-domain-containing protein n=1 Tax=Lasiosphaeria miniovina TaxID=1954250 RepID=A0AA40DR64_9PEZI|nr:nucleotide-sugar transporter-domain-containing protein [Lasiosphaeria miniovina]KAK0710242.1 nucleotide-sugar transporter-domain-containing protein [Lasiosphaeria miniovina]
MAFVSTPPPAGGPTFFGVPMKQASLVTLTFQNSALILIMHYSRVMEPSGDHRYFASTAVFLNEVIKLAIALTFSILEVSASLAPQTPVTVIFEQIYNSVFSGDGWKLAIPAVLYTLENTLQYVALSNLDAVHFQVLYQLKILTTAFFMVVLLGRNLGFRRWMSLVVLTLGVSVVSLPSSQRDPSMDIHDFSDHFFPRSMHELGQIAGGVTKVAAEVAKRGLGGLAGELNKRSASYQGIREDQNIDPPMSYSIGMSAVLVSAVVSGLTGVYFEKVLKGSSTPVSVWTRNIQLSFYSLFPAFFLGVVVRDGVEIAKHGFFDGYSGVVWTAIVFQATGGVLSSLCINYADNIAKNFATSISIIISSIFSVFVFGFEITFPFVLGAGLVMAAIYFYNLPDRKRGRPPPINIVSYEKTTIDSTPRYLDENKLNLKPMDAAGRSIRSSSSRPVSPLQHHPRTPSARGKRFDE